MKRKLGMDTIDLVEQAVEYRERMKLLTAERDEWKRKAEKYYRILVEEKNCMVCLHYTIDDKAYCDFECDNNHVKFVPFKGVKE